MNAPRRILALDLGTSCGWAISPGHPHNPPIAGAWNLTPARGESPGMRYLNLRAQLNTTRGAFPNIDLIAYELPHQRGGAATEIAYGLLGTLKAWTAELNPAPELYSIHSATLKKWATGNGRADKPAMLAAANNLTPVTLAGPAAFDEADAILLLHYTAQKFAPSLIRKP